MTIIAMLVTVSSATCMTYGVAHISALVPARETGIDIDSKRYTEFTDCKQQDLYQFISSLTHRYPGVHAWRDVTIQRISGRLQLPGSQCYYFSGIPDV